MRALAALGVIGLFCSSSGCHSDALEAGNSNAGAGKTSTCSQITDLAACSANAACEPVSCPTCNAAGTLLGCYDKGTAPAVVCEPPPCAPAPAGCAALTTESACFEDPTCEAVYLCGEPTMQGCTEITSPKPQFGPFCYKTRCDQHTAEASCEADAACHSSFLETTQKACAPEHPDCNLNFDHCTNGAPLCVSMDDSPCIGNVEAVCSGDYVPEYAIGGCLIGCVHAALCAGI